MSQLEMFGADGEAVPAPPPPVSRAAPKLEPAWLEVLADEFDKPYMHQLREFLIREKQQYTVYPSGNDMFNAFWYTPFDKVRVVVLGQDPYHGPNQAHGLCFSVQHGVPPPPSLRNIFQELHTDLNLPIPSHGCLTHWAEQGVFLLNTCLSVRAGNAHSHSGHGWETFTDRVITELNRRHNNLVFLLWGRPAQRKMAMIDARRHLVLTAAHPSPLSAHNGFFGCQHFSTTNTHLAKLGHAPVDWRLP